MTQNLYLEFCGEEYTMTPDQVLTFGRSGDLVVDENPYMHRVVGRFVCIDGGWRVENTSRRQTIEVRDISGPSSAVAAPGKVAGLVYGEFTCSFTAGPTRYEITGALEEFEWATDLLGPEGLDGTETVDWGRVDLNDDQRLLLLALSEQHLLNPHRPDLPVISNRQGAVRLGWSITKFNRKLDHLCEKVRRAGVVGVHGDLGASAHDRRRRLVEHALSVPLVTVDELSLLEVSPEEAA
ncbi:MAG TPA: hypothetical protein VL068_14575 [Microthrixaceae bacterium]|nr:hypothetical protein [Microthrixaceae bacterium]